MSGSSRIKGITIEIDGDSTGLNKALASTDKSLSSTQKELNDVNRLLKVDPKNTELLAQKQKLLAESVGETKKRLDTLRDAERQAASSSKNYDKWKAAYTPIQEEISKTSAKLEELKSRQKELEDIDEVDTDAYTEITKEIQKTNRELRDLRKSAKDVSNEFGNPISDKQYDALKREIIETEHKLGVLENQAEETNNALASVT